MSDTPETDLEDDLYLECASPCIVKESTGAIFTGDFVPAKFARRLERERNHLLAALQSIMSSESAILTELREQAGRAIKKAKGEA